MHKIQKFQLCIKFKNSKIQKFKNSKIKMENSKMENKKSPIAYK